MKNKNELFNLIKDYPVCFSCNDSQLLKEYLNIPYTEISTITNEEVVVIACLTTTNPIDSEIIVSYDYKLKDFCSEGSLKDISCITVFIKCQDIYLRDELKKLSI